MGHVIVHTPAGFILSPLEETPSYKKYISFVCSISFFLLFVVGGCAVSAAYKIEMLADVVPGHDFAMQALVALEVAAPPVNASVRRCITNSFDAIVMSRHFFARTYPTCFNWLANGYYTKQTITM